MITARTANDGESRRSWDDPTGSHWSMADLRTALQGGLQRVGRPRYDALIFDACLMAQYEVGLEIKP